jgi:hypothetical protein
MLSQVTLGDRLDDDLAAEAVDVVEDDCGGAERSDGVDGGVEARAVKLGSRVGVVVDADNRVAAIRAVAPAGFLLRGEAIPASLLVSGNTAINDAALVRVELSAGCHETLPPGALGAYLTGRAWPPRALLGGRFSLIFQKWPWPHQVFDITPLHELDSSINA